MEKPFIKARVNNVAKLILKKLSHAPQLLATMTLINQQPITLRIEPPPEKNYCNSQKPQMMASMF